MQKDPKGFEQITVSSAAIGPTTATLNAITTKTDLEANCAVFRCETADVRWRDDGSNPTASVGYLLKAGEELVYDGNLRTLKFIRTASDATVDAAYYRAGF